MRYQVFCGSGTTFSDYCLYDSDLDEFQIETPILSSEINSVDEFKFTIYPTHPYFENISKLSSIVTVYRDDKLIFKGRVITCEYGFHNEKSVTCEGVLAFLLDTFIRPFDFPNNEQFEDLNYKEDNVIEYFLNWVLKCHNEQAKSFQKIKLGTVTVTDPNNYIARSSIEYLSCFEVIKTRLLDTHGGYLAIRIENGENILDYVEDFTNDGKKAGNKLVCTQKIEFGENLIDLVQESDASNVKTGIIPLGARLEDDEGTQTDKYLTIEDLPDEVLSDGIIKSGDCIINTFLSEKYGAIYEMVKMLCSIRYPHRLATTVRRFKIILSGNTLVFMPMKQ